MKKLANSLVSVLSALVIVFAAACAYSFADIDVTDKHTSAESSERVSESSEAEDTSQDNSLSTQTTKTHGTADVNVSAAATESSAGKTENINKPTDTKTEKTSSDSEIGTITLEINEVGDGWFTACHPWPSPNQYEVIYTLDKRYKSGDIVEVSYNADDGFLEVFPIRIIAVSVKKSDFKLEENMVYKPVIYLYPKKKEHISVKLRYSGNLTKTIPEYGSGWEVTAYPDGRIINSDGSKHAYLFWEGEGKHDYDFSRGFCVKGDDAESFLCEKLALMGLSKSETEDFNEFWVPHLQKNPYNRICFQTTAYTDDAKLFINPKPDSLLRVFMVYTPLKQPIKIQGQSFDKFERKGFTVVEWGGALESF